MTVFFIEPEPASKLISNASAKLDRSTFTTCRTTHKVGKDRRNKDQWSRAKRHIILRADRREYLIRTAILASKFLIKKYDHQTGYRQQEKDPCVFCPVICDKFECPRKKAADKADGQAGQYCEDQPFDKIRHIIADVSEIIIQIFSLFRIIFVLCVVHKFLRKVKNNL